MLTLESVLAPQSFDDFLRGTWQQHHALKSGTGKESRFASLLPLEEIELLATSIPASNALIQVTKDGKGATVRTNNDQLVDVVALRNAFSNGHTVMLGKLHRRSKEIARVCRDLEQSLLRAELILSHNVTAGAFLTPPSAQAFGAHYDDHDIFVLQCAGSKEWRLYDYIDPTPVRPQYGASKRTLPAPSAPLTIKAGDLLYVPRGMYHEVRTSSEHSLHISIGIYSTTWVDLLRAMSDSVSGLCQPIPRHTSVGSNLKEQLAVRLNEITSDDLANAISRLHQEAVDRALCVPGNGFEKMVLPADVGSR